MSKPITRVTFSVLICLAIVAAVFTVAYGASMRAGVASGRVPTNAGMTMIVGSDRHPKLQTYYSNFEQTGKGHGCDLDSRFAPDD